MSDDDLTVATDANLEPSAGKRLRAVVNDAFAFIRSAEANAAIANVTLEQLMGDQINRNGETSRSNASKFDPFGYDPKADEAAGDEPLKRANFPSGVDTNRPTKLDRVLAIVNSVKDIAAQIKEMSPIDVAKPEDYTDIADIAAPEDE